MRVVDASRRTFHLLVELMEGRCWRPRIANSEMRGVIGLVGACRRREDAAMGVQQTAVTLAVLAGGMGSRMGGPKSRLVLGGRPILERLAERFAWRGPTLLVTSPGNERPPGWERFGAEVTDARGGEGPLRGVLTALERATTEVVAVVTVDMPAIGAGEVEWLVGQSDGVAVMCSRATGGEARVEPFPLVIARAAREVVARRLAAGNRSVYALREEAGVSVVRAPVEWRERVWANLNRPADLEAFEQT
jgi:molybdopterin-guanine dinucleotide biosynthesis protein A